MREDYIDDTVSDEQRISRQIDGNTLNFTGSHKSRGPGTIQAIGEGDFSVDLEVAVNTDAGSTDFTTLETLTNTSPARTFQYSPGCLYRFKLTTDGYAGIIKVRCVG